MTFKDLPEDLQKLLVNLQIHDKLIELDYNLGIKLNSVILENKDVYTQAIQYIQNNYKDVIKELIFFLFRQLYELKRPIVSFWDFYDTYNYYSIKHSSISTATPTPTPEDRSSEGSEVSVGHSVLDLSALYRWLEEKKWFYCIWISKDDRDHNKDCIGQINPDGVVFQKLVQGLGLTFSNQNGWETIVYNKEGLYWSWAINKNGYCRFWINDNLSWELFFRLLNQKLKICNLTTEELQEIIECLETSSGKKLFKLETANLIGPREIIERDFNKACLVYLKAYFEGLYLPVEVKIDKSTGPWEIEWKGAEGPTRRLQDVTIRAFETVQSLGKIEFLEESSLEMGAATNELVKNIESSVGVLQQQVLPKQELLTEFSELEGRIFNLDIKTDIQQIELKEHFRDVLKGVKNNSTNLGEAIKLMDKGIQELKEHYSDIIFENTEPIIAGLSTIQNELKNGVKEIKEDIKKAKDDIKELIQTNFNTVKDQLKNNLYLTLKLLNKLPGLTARELSQELKVSQKTIYSYLKKLQDKQLINSQIQNQKGGKRKGRPPKLFKLKKV